MSGVVTGAGSGGRLVIGAGSGSVTGSRWRFGHGSCGLVFFRWHCRITSSWRGRIGRRGGAVVGIRLAGIDVRGGLPSRGITPSSSNGMDGGAVVVIGGAESIIVRTGVKGIIGRCGGTGVALGNADGDGGTVVVVLMGSTGGWRDLVGCEVVGCSGSCGGIGGASVEAGIMVVGIRGGGVWTGSVFLFGRSCSWDGLAAGEAVAGWCRRRASLTR